MATHLVLVQAFKVRVLVGQPKDPDLLFVDQDFFLVLLGNAHTLGLELVIHN